MNNKNRRGPYPSTLSSNQSNNSQSDNNHSSAHPSSNQRFMDTRELLEYGVKLGIGKATQEQAIQQLKDRFPEQATMFDNPMFLTALKMAMPLIGIQLAQQLSNETLSNRILDASQGMLLVNTIDATADVSHALTGQLLEMGSFLLGLYGLTGADAAEGARQLAEDFGMPIPNTPPAEKVPEKVSLEEADTAQNTRED